MSTISASTTSTTAFKITTDTTGALVFQTGASPTTAMTLGSDQSVTFAGTPTYSGGTANGVAYLNGSKVLTTGTALTFDGTALASTGSGTQSFTVTSSATAAYVQTTGAGAVNARLQSNSTTAQVGTLSNHNFAVQTNSNNVATFDTSGNLGLGVTPSAWTSSLSGTIENLSGGLYPYHPGGGTYDIGLFVNAYYDGSWRYKNTGSASARYIMGVGTSATSAGHYWGIAGTGTAGNPITFTEAMTLNGSGYLGVGYTSPAYRLHVRSATSVISQFEGNNGNNFLQLSDNNGTNTVTFGSISAGNAYMYAGASKYVALYSGTNENFRLDSTGNVVTPRNACFLVDRSGQQNPYSASNAIVFNSAVFDQNSNFNTSTGVFTAPVTGKYLLSATILVQGSSTGAEYDLSLVTSNRNYYGAPGRIEYQLGTSWGDGYIAMQVTQIVDMDTSDTAYVTFTTFGAGYIYGGGGWTRFSGCLIS